MPFLYHHRDYRGFNNASAVVVHMKEGGGYIAETGGYTGYGSTPDEAYLDWCRAWDAKEQTPPIPDDGQ